MKKHYIFYIILAIILLAGIYLLLLTFLPKSAGYFPVFLVLVVLDLYLWNSLKNKIFKFKPFFKYFLSILYWIPFIALLTYTILSAFVKPQVLFSGVSVYVMGVVFTIYISKLLPVFLLLITDITRLTKCAISRFSAKASRDEIPNGKLISRSKFLQNLGLIAGGIVMSGFITGMAKWATEFKIWKHKLILDQLPGSLKGLKIVQISDMHLGSWPSKASLKEAVDMINSLNPDLVLFTGDLVNYTTDEAYPYEDILKEIRSRYGIFTVLGNHDYGDYVGWDTPADKEKNISDLEGLYSRMDWHLLNNANEIIKVKDHKIAVIGVENWSSYDRFPRLGDLKKAVVNSDEADLRLLLSHDPTHWENIVSKEFHDIEVTFSGHTHGFQFGIDNDRMKWSPAKYLYKYWSGLYSNENETNPNQYLYVNRGLGNIGYPGRIGILPEITFIELS